MRLISLAILASISLVGLASKASATPPLGFTLVFEDNFDGTTLDTSAWGYRQSGYEDTSNVTVSGGALHLNMTRVSTSTAENGYRGSGIVSKQAFEYGYYETKAKLINDNGGWHPAFWTQIWDGQYAVPIYNTNFTEVDIFEGASGTSSSGGYLTWASGTTAGKQKYASSRASFSGDQYSSYHTYGVDYESTGLTFYFDGVKVKTMNYPTKASGPFNSPMSIWLSVVPYNASKLDSSQSPGHSYGTIDFDYVRYYTTTGAISTTSPARRAKSVTTYSDDFESGTAAGWATNGVGSWGVLLDGDYVYKQASSSGDAFSYYYDTTTSSGTWANTSLETGIKMYLSVANNCGIFGRFQDTDNYYYLEIDGASNQVRIQKKVGGKVTILASAALNVSLGTTYTLKFDMKNQQLTGYVNGTAMVSATDTSFVVGRAGIKSYNQSFSANHFSINPL